MSKTTSWGAVAVLVFSTFLLASAPPFIACLSAALALLAVVPMASSRRVLKRPTPLLLFIGLPLLGTLLQIIPLPSLVIEWIASNRYELAVANAKAYGDTVPSWLTISMDWPATVVELAKFLGYFAFAYLCSRLCVSKRARLRLIHTVVLCGTGVAVLALGHRLLAATSFMGLYTPSTVYPQSISPFFNPNHLAGYLAFVTPLGIGLALHRRSWLWAGCALLCALTALQTVSRGGTVALLGGIAVCLFLGFNSKAIRARRYQVHQRDGLPKALILIGVIGGFFVLAVLGTTAGQELLDLSIHREAEAGKFLAWGSVPGMLQEFPWLGVGRGAFEASFPQYQPVLAVTYSHIENELLQTLLDWGIPLTLAMIVALVLLAKAIALRGCQDAPTAGGIAAIVALGIHSTVDFGLHLPAIALSAIAVLATLLPSELILMPGVSGKNALAGGYRKRLFALRMTGIIAGVMVCALGASALTTTGAQELQRREFSQGFSGTAEEILTVGRQISLRHPSNYLVAAKTARSLWQKRSSRAFALLARALELNPNQYGVHVLAAHMLAASQNPRQALSEYRVALQIRGPNVDILRSLAEGFAETEDVLLALPKSPIQAYRHAGILLSLDRPEVAEAYAKAILESEEKLPQESYFALVKVAVRAAIRNGNHSWAVSIAQTCHRREQSGRTLLLLVRALRASQLPLAVLELLEPQIAQPLLQREPDEVRLEAFHIYSEIQFELENLPAARKTTEQLLKESVLSPKFATKYLQAGHKLMAGLEEAVGHRHQAKWHREELKRLRQK